MPGCRIRVAASALLMIVAASSHGQDSDDWTFVIGTGLANNIVDGTIGFTSFRGPETGDIDLSPSDFRDLADSAIGFNFLAARGKLLIGVDYGNVTLLDESTTLIAEGVPPLLSRFEQEIEVFKLAGMYRISASQRNQLYVTGGVHYVSHDYDVRLGIGSLDRQRTLSHSWTNAVGGIRHVHAFSNRWAWTNAAGIGVGDADTYGYITSALGWQMADRWTLLGFANWRTIDFENDSPGDPNWYRYDADEAEYGVAFAYAWGRRLRRQ